MQLLLSLLTYEKLNRWIDKKLVKIGVNLGLWFLPYLEELRIFSWMTFVMSVKLTGLPDEFKGTVAAEAEGVGLMPQSEKALSVDEIFMD